MPAGCREQSTLRRDPVDFNSAYMCDFLFRVCSTKWLRLIIKSLNPESSLAGKTTSVLDNCFTEHWAKTREPAGNGVTWVCCLQDIYQFHVSSPRAVTLLVYLPQPLQSPSFSALKSFTTCLKIITQPKCSFDLILFKTDSMSPKNLILHSKKYWSTVVLPFD